MGTNYYHEIELCDKCHNTESVHIGFSAVGWTFMFQATETIRSWKDWQARLGQANGRIVDEYGREFSLAEFAAMVERKQTSTWGPENRPATNHAVEYPEPTSFVDPEGYSFSTREFS